MNDDLKFLVIGCGSIGKRHLGNLKALGIRHLAGCDNSPERRQQTGTQFQVPCFASFAEAGEFKPNVVLITTPTNLHLAPALAAARHACHLFIEKPLADSMDGTDELIEEIGQRKLVTLGGCNLRFHPGLQKVKQLVAEGVAGKITSARVEFGQYLPDWHPTEDYRLNYSASKALGGGIILDAIHELDYIRWLLGEVTQVGCFGGKISRLEIETEDTAAIQLRFASGAIGEVHLDYVQRAYRRTCQIIGDEGTIHWDYAEGRVAWYIGATKQWHHFTNPAGWQPNLMYVAEMEHFLACLRGEQPATQDISEARRVLQIALAAKESDRLGKIISV